MNTLKLSIPLALGSLFLAAGSLHAAETTPTPPAEKPAPNVTDLENRIKTLETRIHDLEAQLDDRTARNSDRNLRQFRDRMKRELSFNFDDLFDQMRNEMEQGGFSFQFGPDSDADSLLPNSNGPQWHSFGGPNAGLGLSQAEKPRLGVQLNPLTDVLRERFKNDAKQGAFVMAVVPDSPAEKAGIQVGDAIIKVGGKDAANADAVMNAIRNAPAGKLDLTVLRQNKEVTLTPDLQVEAENSDDAFPPATSGRWLRRGDLRRNNGNNGGMTGNGAANGRLNRGNANVKMRTELKASALEVTDELAKSLNLSDDQRKKMTEVLQKHSQAASEEVTAQNSGNTGNGLNLSVNADVGKIIDKHVAAAGTELKTVLSEAQMRDWKDYLATHNTVQFSNWMTLRSNDAPEQAPAPTPAPGSGNGF